MTEATLEGLTNIDVVAPVVGHLGYLTAEEEAKVAALVKALDLSLAVNDAAGESAEHAAARFLRARQWDAKKAKSLAKADIEWRARKKTATIRSLTEVEVLKCPMEVVHSRAPVATLPGPDRFRRPVMFKFMGHSCDLAKITKHTSQDALALWHVFNVENTLATMRPPLDPSADPRSPEGYRQERMLVIVDCNGWRGKLVSATAMIFLKRMAEIDGNHYVERLGSALVLNTPPALMKLWNVVKRWVHPLTQRKVAFMKGPEEYVPVLRDLIPSAVLPSNYGGTGPAIFQHVVMPESTPADDADDVGEIELPDGIDAPGEDGVEDPSSPSAK
eukprot:TRINITY_DN35482_c0_g1_i1.p1 TRINITY_DN35482_c0_g1~~TRINITY_DN35482_c0_g1_i1.p1  ORF type:complete len:331 (+),score=70.05 TRINITY_DN35482_c0_g1_i1:299-1291(+)